MSDTDNPFDPPAIIPDLAFEDYKRIDAANASGLKIMLDRSPAHVHGMPPKASDAMTLGTLVHTATLEPDKMAAEYVVAPTSTRSTNAGKAELVRWLCEQLDIEPPASEQKAEGKRLDEQLAILEPMLEAKGLTKITQAQHDQALAVAEAVRGHPLAGPLLDGAETEVTLLANDPRTGQLVKIRTDALKTSDDLIIDLKTADDASFDAFSRAAGRYQYHLQAALYRWVYSWVTERTPGFIHIVAETQPPHGVVCYDMDQEAVERGGQRARVALNRWSECARTEHWPSYVPEFVPLSLPKWSL